MTKVIFLFDIDGTLIKSRGVGGRAMADTCRDLYGVDSLPPIPLAGRTDHAIFSDVFRAMDRPFDEHYQQFRDAYHSRLRANWNEQCFEILPGVTRVLSALGECEWAVCGLLTGNSRTAAEIKLSVAGLWKYFQCGGYGDYDSCRNRVALQAQNAAVSATGISPEKLKFVTIGDTPHDIQCARSIGSMAIAVATGGFARRDLIACEPDLLLNDLADFDFSNLTHVK